MKAAQLSGLIFVVFTIHSGDSIQCFKCSSANDDNCILLVKDSLKYLDNCINASEPEAEFKCLETLVKEEQRHTLVRDCISTERLNYCEQLKKDPKLNTLICKLCDERDGCNDDEYYLNGSNELNAYFLINLSLIYLLYTTCGKNERRL